MHMFTVMRWLTHTVLALAIIVFVVFGLGPHTGLYRSLSMNSGGMEPTFAAGDAIVVTPLSTSRVRVGDVISYHAPVEGRPLITHRVVRLVRGGASPIVQTRGDSNESTDPWTAQLRNGTVWKERFAIPGAGRANSVLRQPAVRTFTAFQLPLVLLFLMLASIWLESDARRDRDQEPGEFELADDDAWMSEPLTAYENDPREPAA